jgi:hypothetical protein
MNENAQWQMIKDSVLFALSLGFSVSLFHFYLKKNRLEVYCSVFLRVGKKSYNSDNSVFLTFRIYPKANSSGKLKSK